MMVNTWRKLRKLGIVGINERNADMILKYNRRRYYPLVDDKLKTKKLAIEHNIQAPQLYATLETEHDVKQLEKILAQHNDFVIKPAQGAGGDGIIVITSQVRGRYRKSNGQLVDIEFLRHHCSNILAGLFSLGGHSDVAMIEQRIQAADVFSAVSFQGVPDVRVIVFRGFPIMSMLRLPTQQSQGKANLHQGAIGVGVNLTLGQTTYGVWHNEPITEHPDTGNPITGITIPHWDQILLMASRCYDFTKLGYLGADIVLDARLGPMLLELNARPGLTIQIANQCGLRKRVDPFKDADDKMPAEERVAFALNKLRELEA